MNITAKVKLVSKDDEGKYSQLAFGPDYEDSRNSEWAVATPALFLDISVKAEVAAHFEVGQAYTLTFTRED